MRQGIQFVLFIQEDLLGGSWRTQIINYEQVYFCNSTCVLQKNLTFCLSLEDSGIQLPHFIISLLCCSQWLLTKLLCILIILEL